MNDEYKYPRRRVLYELSDDELAYEWREHKAWEIKGSTKQRYHADIRRSPYIESHFRTLKYRPDVPRSFGPFEDAHAHCGRSFD